MSIDPKNILESSSHTTKAVVRHDPRTGAPAFPDIFVQLGKTALENLVRMASDDAPGLPATEVSHVHRIPGSTASLKVTVALELLSPLEAAEYHAEVEAAPRNPHHEAEVQDILNDALGG